MKTTILLAVSLVLCLAGPASAQEPAAADSAAIRQAALDYIEGYYEGDAGRMERALHPQLVKRIVRAQDGEARISEMTAQQLIEGTAAGWGARVPAEVRRTDVEILDIFRNVAAVRVDAHDWIDYMQLARFDGEWKIVNVLWELRERNDG